MQAAVCSTETTSCLCPRKCLTGRFGNMQKSTIEVSSRPYGRGSSLSALWLLSAELSTKKKWRNFHQQGNCELRTLLALSSLGSHRQRITTCCTWGKTPERVCVVKTGIWCPDRTAIAAEWHRVAQSSAVMYKKKKKSQPHHSLTKVPQKNEALEESKQPKLLTDCCQVPVCRAGPHGVRATGIF